MSDLPFGRTLYDDNDDRADVGVQRELKESSVLLINTRTLDKLYLDK